MFPLCSGVRIIFNGPHWITAQVKIPVLLCRIGSFCLQSSSEQARLGLKTKIPGAKAPEISFVAEEGFLPLLLIRYGVLNKEKHVTP